MARPKKADGEKQEKMHISIQPGLKGRYQALQAVTGLDLSFIAESALLRAIEAYERDPGEIVRDRKAEPPK